MIPEPRLRGALAMLLGTVGEPAIDEILHGRFFEYVEFGRPSLPGAVGESWTRPDGTNGIIMHELLSHEHPALFSPWLVHEAMHNDRVVGAWEEAVAHLVQSMVTAQMLRDFSEQVGTTPASRISMTNFLALFFNSTTVLESRSDLFPGGSKQFASYPEWGFGYDPGPGATPGSDLLVALLDELGIEIDRPNYDEALVRALVLDEILDSGRVVSPEDIIAIAELLELEFDPDP
jgi:hypothetical protein